VAVDVPLEHFPVVDAMLPGFSCVAQDEPALQFVEIAAEDFTPLAARREYNGGRAAESRRVMVLCPCWHSDDNGLDVAADVDPFFTAQTSAGSPVQCGADGHCHGGGSADSRSCRCFGIRSQCKPA